MIKLVAIDLDGTLYNRKKELHPNDISAIKSLRQQGCHVIITTGRPTKGYKKVLDALDMNDDDTYTISFNGAAITNVGTGEIIYRTSIPAEAVKMVYEDCLKFSLDPISFNDQGDIITPSANRASDYESTTSYMTYFIEDFTKLKDDETFFKALVYGSKEELDNFTSKFSPALHEGYNVVRSAEYLLEFNNKNTDKWEAVKILAQHLDIPLDSVMCIGDADNDFTMIKNAKIGVAMGNAFESVKNVSDFVTLTNNEAGVAHAINTLILNK